jgi:hypothetical protein
MKELLLSYTVYSVRENIREYRGYVVFVLPILWVGSELSAPVLTGGLCQVASVYLGAYRKTDLHV